MIIAKSKHFFKPIAVGISNILKLRDKAEQICFDYLKNLGTINPQCIRLENIKSSRRFNKLNFGINLVGKYHKFVIYKKTLIKGYITNDYKIEKVITFYLLHPPPQKFEPIDLNFESFPIEACIKEKLNKWELVHGSIFNYFIPKVLEDNKKECQMIKN